MSTEMCNFGVFVIFYVQEDRTEKGKILWPPLLCYLFDTELLISLKLLYKVLYLTMLLLIQYPFSHGGVCL